MKVLLDIKDEKAAFVLELLHSLKFVKARPISPLKADLMLKLQSAVEEVNDIKAGKKQGVKLEDFLDEISS